MKLEQLVERITDEVIRDMQAKGEIASVESSVRSEIGRDLGRVCDAGEVLVIICGDPRSAFSQGSAIEKLGLAVSYFMSRDARIRVGDQTMVGMPPQADLIDETQESRVFKQLEGARFLVVPDMPMQAVAGVASLAGTDIYSRLVLRALLEGKRIYAALGFRRPPVPEIQRQIDEYIEKLRDYGIIVVDSKSLVEEVEQGLRMSGLGGRRRTESAAASYEYTIHEHAIEPACSDPASPDDCSGCGRCIIEKPAVANEMVQAGASRIGAALGVGANAQRLAGMIDHTLLKPDATRDQIKKLCYEAKKYGFASVCVNPSYVSLASELLKGTPVKVCTVIGFPLGATTPTTKAMETRDAIANGASEIDMVINVGALKSGDYDLVKKDIEAVVEAARGKALVKVILETALLTDEEKVKGCLLAKLAGADFVKTSTGFRPGGATVQDIMLMRKVVGEKMGVKASGGIRDYESTRKMIEAGANRIGASAGVKIVKEACEHETR
jgi:deoxyribose-phosphate aldolase